MAVDGNHPELAHAPGLIANGFADLRAFGANRTVVVVDVVDFEVGEVGMVTQVGWRKRVRAEAGSNRARA